MEKVRLGIIGVGNMGMPVSNLITFEGECPELELTAICDISQERRQWATNTFKDKDVKVFADAEEMMTSGLIDAVYIAVPHYDHPTLAMLAFKHKLHVMIEKPAGVYTKMVREMNEAAEKAGVKFGIMFQCRTIPVFKKVKQLLDSGEYGQIRGVTWLVTSWYRSQSYYDSGSWRATWAGEGGGVLLNQCPHNLDLIQWLCGMPVEITAKCSVAQWHDVEIEDDVSAIFKYENGALGTFITSTGICPGTNRLEIATDKGTIIVENSSTLTVYELEMKEQEFAKSKAAAFGSPRRSKITYDMYKEKLGGHSLMLNAFAGAILRDEPLVANGVEGINSLTLSNGMYLSSWTNSTVKLPLDEDLFYEELKKRIATSKHKEVEAVFTDSTGSYQGTK